MLKRILLTLVLYLLFCSSAQATTWTRLTTGTSNSGNGQITSLTYASNISAGSLLFVSVSWYSNNIVPTVTDSIGNGAFALVASGYEPSYGSYWAFYWFVNTKGSGADTINVSYGASEAYTGVQIDEFQTPGGTIAIDGSASQILSNVSGTNSLSSGSLTTTHNGDLLYASVYNRNVASGCNLSAGTGYTLGQTTATWVGGVEQVASEYLIQASSGTISGTFTPSQVGNYSVVIAAAFSSSASASSPKAGWGF